MKISSIISGASIFLASFVSPLQAENAAKVIKEPIVSTGNCLPKKVLQAFNEKFAPIDTVESNIKCLTKETQEKIEQSANEYCSNPKAFINREGKIVVLGDHGCNVDENIRGAFQLNRFGGDPIKITDYFENGASITERKGESGLLYNYSNTDSTAFPNSSYDCILKDGRLFEQNTGKDITPWH